MANSDTKATAFYPIEDGYFAIKMNEDISIATEVEIEAAKTELIFKKNGGQVKLVLSLTFTRNDDLIRVGSGNVEWPMYGLYKFETPDSHAQNGVIESLFFFLKNDNRTIKIRSNNSDFDIESDGDKQDHSQSLIEPV